MKLTLRDYQSAAIDSIYSYFEAHPDGNPLVVIPTGGGKSLVIAEFLRRVFAEAPHQRVIVATHVKELIEQNYRSLLQQWPDAPAGIYSAGLRRRDAEDYIVFGGIQSFYSRAEELGHRDLILVDEAHLVPRKGQGRYLSYFEALREINPAARVVGFTATPYRMDSGMLTEGKGRLFTDICYDVDVVDLIDQGYLAPLVPKATSAEIDVRGVRKTGGDFNLRALEDACTAGDLVARTVDEMVVRGAKRKKWLVFCVGIAHAEMVVDALRSHNISVESVFGHTPRADRDDIIERYRAGGFRALVNVGVLTTGFDAPETDMLAVLRPTASAGLFVQIMGRGMRCAPGKTECLVLDYGANVMRHGPINKIRASKKEAEQNGDAPAKACPECRTLMAIASRECPTCGYEFPAPEITHDTRAARANVIERDAWRIAEVDSVLYMRHTKKGKPDSLKVMYLCGMLSFAEWVCLEHDGYAQRKAVQWWLDRGARPYPDTVTDALERTGELRCPIAIKITKDGKHDRVSGYVWAPDSASEEAVDEDRAQCDQPTPPSSPPVRGGERPTVRLNHTRVPSQWWSA